MEYADPTKKRKQEEESRLAFLVECVQDLSSNATILDVAILDLQGTIQVHSKGCRLHNEEGQAVAQCVANKQLAEENGLRIGGNKYVLQMSDAERLIFREHQCGAFLWKAAGHILVCTYKDISATHCSIISYHWINRLKIRGY